MAPSPRSREVPPPTEAALALLLDSDPSIRWQTLMDLFEAPADQVAREQARVAVEGMGARLLSIVVKQAE